MEVLFTLPLIFLPLFLPLLAGLMARNFGRKFWSWFLIGLALPLVANIILLCLPDKAHQEMAHLEPVRNDQLFDHLFIEKKIKA